MAREIKKPTSIQEIEIKEYDGPVEIDVTPREEPIETKEDVEEAAQAPAITPKKKPEAVPTMSFNAWFQKRSANNPKMKLSYREAIEAHFKSIGVTSPSSEEVFDEALTHFGI